MRAIGLLVAFVVVTAGTRGALPDRSVEAPSVSVIAATGGRPQRIAFLQHVRREPCGVVRVWLLKARVVPRVSAPCRDQRATLYGLAQAGEQIAWASRSPTGQGAVWFARVRAYPDQYTYTVPRSIAHVSARAPEFAIADGGDGPGIAYASGRRITYATSYYRYSWLLGSAAVRLATDGGYLAVQEKDGPVSIYLAGSGPNDPVPAARYDYPPGAIDALKIQRQTVLVLRGDQLDVRPNYYFGNSIVTLTLPPASSYGDDHCGRVACPSAAFRLADLDRGLVAYIVGAEIHILRLNDRRDIVVRRNLGGTVHAELQPTGLSYSAGGRVYFVSRDDITRALAR